MQDFHLSTLRRVCRGLSPATRRPALAAPAWLLAAAMAAPGSASALPAPVKTGHPRLYTSSAKLDQFKHQLALGPQVFPAAGGKLSFEFYAQAKGPGSRNDAAVFSEYNSTRNGIFVRHIDANDANGTVRLQIGLQKANATYYIAVASIDVKADQWSRITVQWNAQNYTASVSVNPNVSANVSEQVVPMTWNKINQKPEDWLPSQQTFTFSGRPGEQIRSVELRDSNAGLLAAYDRVDTRLVAAWADFIRETDAKVAQLAACPTVAAPAESPALCNVATGHRLTVVDTAQKLALAYRMTGKTAYLDAAIDYANKMLAVAPTAGTEWTMGGRVAAFGLLYDWLYGEMEAMPLAGSGTYRTALAQAIKTTIAATSARHSDDLAYHICGNQPGMTDTATVFDCAVTPVFENWNRYATPAQPSIAHTYIGGHSFSDVTAVAAGLLAIAEEQPEVLPLLDTMYAHFDKGFMAARAAISVDGGHHMGFAYGVSSIPERVLMWRSALQGDLPVLAGDWQSQLVYPYIYGLRHDGSFPASGDNFTTAVGDSMVGNLALWAASEANDAVAWSFYQNQVLPRRASNAAMVLERLYWPVSLAPEALSRLALSRYFRRSGQVVMRDTWNFADATLLEFKSSTLAAENHQHLDQNSFSLNYKAPLLLDTGLYENYGSSHWSNYYTRTVAHNSIIVFDPTERFIGYKNAELSNDGGQWYPDPNTRYPTIEEIAPGAVNYMDGVVAYENTAAYTYTVGNASKAYSASKLDRNNGFLRSVLFLRPPVLGSKPVAVVFDHVRTARALPATFLLHAANNPVADVASSPLGSGRYQFAFADGADRTMTIRNGGGMASVQTILPLNASVLKVGGKDQGGQACDQIDVESGTFGPANVRNGDCRFLVRERQPDGKFVWRNYTADVSTQQSSMADVGAWRIEVSAPKDPEPGSTQHFLHVISVADNDQLKGNARGVSAVRLPADADTEALLLGGSLVLSFNRGSQPASSRTWTSSAGNAGFLATGLKADTCVALSTQPVAGGVQYHLQETAESSGCRRSSPQGIVSTLD